MIELHPLCTLFPRVAGAEFDALVADIKANGLRQPITLHEGMILDGGNRYRACLEAGIEPVFTEFDGSNIVSFVLSANLHRRHLSAGQQAAIVASAQDWAKAQVAGSNQHKARAESGSAILHDLTSAAGRAAESGASLRTQKMADKVAKADPELAKRVAHGEVSLPKAVQEVEHKAGQASAMRARSKPRQVDEPRPTDHPDATPKVADPEAVNLRAQVARLQELAAEQASMLEEAQAEIESLSKIADAGDQMAEARNQIRQLQAEVRVMRERQAGLMNEAAEAKRLARSWRLKLERIEKARA